MTEMINHIDFKVYTEINFQINLPLKIFTEIKGSDNCDKGGVGVVTV